ncbi:hypothetical protein J2Y69_003064 [Microbacterium resistens]|uniref:Uncharacterized protein n=1 Tax=Microbacterium resistens TaxID=156977 RepID=A0ABU1SHI7_9MICO|nr:hypothetical protein [Microbacterium resistens]MDR6868448.1 hypothetical protein [Microbacterium resistens]
MTVRELNGWAPSQVTVDHTGAVISVTVAEPRFTPQEKAVLIAARRRALEPRGSHGITTAEATDPANDGSSPTATARFVAKPSVDFAADAVRVAQEKWPKDDKRALLWRAELVPFD